jgi:Fe2+ or Zn2+ uptake regulation protein
MIPKHEVFIQCGKCGRTEPADLNESPDAAAKRLGWKEKVTKTKHVEEIMWICKDCQNCQGKE